MLTMKVSVIIPTYKGSEFLERAIRSAIAQKSLEYQLEIIVVDDNNPNSQERVATEQIIKKVKEDHEIIYIKHANNRNGSVARNTGILHSNGEFISFLDDDDFYLPGRIERLINKLIESNADIAYSDVLIVKSDTPSNYITATKEGNLFYPLFLDENLFGTGSNIMIRKKAIECNGAFDESLPRQQDFEFLLRQFSCGCIAVPVRDCLVVKAMNSTNNSVDYDRLKNIKYNILNKYANFIDSFNRNSQVMLRASQYKQLLYTAAIENKEVGVQEQLSNLRSIGYSLSFKDRIKIKTLTSNCSLQIRRVRRCGHRIAVLVRKRNLWNAIKIKLMENC